ncbi:hypothetical protein CDSM653_01550 [Caldanaerobacter subterraneus subsp. pacificus DSM 12653]|uniref:Uncharacterized protein n=1 Tax=Caldanaerobacter subterraneus subsp. pacificus DSM 12653 TaxID=391606 RepID=A0A0F5PLE7_9THEO|nr:hypothetical protein CDSM653_01550 [Caldanaerobacter subterraneus subsp. pacificus DSM 12653]
MVKKKQLSKWAFNEGCFFCKKGDLNEGFYFLYGKGVVEIHYRRYIGGRD